jgi:UPF0755 protein
MTSSEDRLAEIARRREGAKSHGRRGLVLAALGAIVVLGVGALAWLALGGLEAPDDVAGSLASQAMGLYLGQRSAELEPVSSDDTPVSFEIAEGESVSSVAERLQAMALVRDAEAFTMLARLRGLDTGIQAGSHVLRASMSSEEVLSELQTAAGEQITVTILEGWRAEQTADALAAAGVGSGEEFLAVISAGSAGDRSTLADKPEGTSLEGYLFPDTYQLDPERSAEDVVARLLDTFEARVRPELPGKGPAADLSVYEIVTLASIVEREAAVPQERGKIARVYLNRLETPPYLLNADPTVQYALGYQPEDETWWKRPLLEVDLQVDSPYNTYRYPGLPPGPIASPGLESIRAVLDAPEGDWQYFVANDVACDGTHVFATTFDEHLANIAAYQTGSCGQ